METTGILTVDFETKTVALVNDYIIDYTLRGDALLILNLVEEYNMFYEKKVGVFTGEMKESNIGRPRHRQYQFLSSHPQFETHLIQVK